MEININLIVDDYNPLFFEAYFSREVAEKVCEQYNDEKYLDKHKYRIFRVHLIDYENLIKFIKDNDTDS